VLGMVDVEFIKLRRARDGWSIREISRRTGWSRQAIRKALASPAVPPRYELSAPRLSPVWCRPSSRLKREGQDRVWR